MRKMRKALLTLLLSVTVVGTSVVPAMAEGTVTSQTQDALQQDAKGLFEDLKGDYVPLFYGGIFESKYDAYWNQDAAAVVGKSAAKSCVDMIKASVGATELDTTGNHGFYCGFTNGVKEISFSGDNKITIQTDKEAITHEYKFVREDKIGGVMEGKIFETEDQDAGEFKYFFLCADTPATTYHIEFRYGSNIDDLLKRDQGPYAYWMGAGILKSDLADASQTAVKNCIALFCAENLAGNETKETVTQRQAIAGVWDADLTAFKNIPAWKNAKMYCVNYTDGTGATYLDMEGKGKYQKSTSYKFYAYDGTYISIDGSTDQTEASKYVVKTVNGKTTLTFTTSDGQITYVKRKISLAASKATLYVKGTTKIKVKGALGTPSYKSSNAKVAKVDKNGLVTALKKGTAVITVSANGMNVAFKVTVKNPTLNRSVVNLTKNQTSKLSVKGSVGKVSYKSSNTKIATVSSKGVIKAKKAGKTTITVKANGMTLKCKVTVKNPVLNKKAVTLKRGKTAKLSVKGRVGKVSYKSGNKKVATVSSKGVIKAKKAGKTTITVKANGVTLKCKVTVKK